MLTMIVVPSPSQVQAITQFVFSVPDNIVNLDGVRYAVNNTYFWIYHDIIINGSNLSPTNPQTYIHQVPFTYDTSYLEPYDRIFAIRDNIAVGEYVRLCVSAPDLIDCKDVKVEEQLHTDPIAWAYFFDYQ